MSRCHPVSGHLSAQQATSQSALSPPGMMAYGHQRQHRIRKVVITGLNTCPGDPRPSFVIARRTWMAETSARSKASSPRPAKTESGCPERLARWPRAFVESFSADQVLLTSLLQVSPLSVAFGFVALAVSSSDTMGMNGLGRLDMDRADRSQKIALRELRAMGVRGGAGLLLRLPRQPFGHDEC